MSTKTLNYPKTEKKEVKEVYHGVTVTDPYRWLEDPDSEPTRKWVGEQVALTDSYLETCDSRKKIQARQMEMQNYEKYGIPFKRGKRYIFHKNDGLQNHYVMYKQTALDAKEETLLDPNTLSKDGTASLGVCKFSDSAELLAYGVKQSGSDWTTIKVRQVEGCKDLADELSWVKFSSISWYADEGFFYSRYPTPKTFQNKDDREFKRGEETDKLLNQSLYYHRVGTNQSEDFLVHSCPENPKWMVSGSVTHDRSKLLISISESCDPENRVFYADLSKWDRKDASGIKIVKLIDNFEAGYSYIHNIGDRFWFLTNRQAPCYKVVAVDIKNADESKWTTIVPEQKLVVLEDADCVNGKFLLTRHLKDVKNVIQLLDMEGKVVKEKFEMPEVACLSVSAHHKQTEIFYKYTSHLYPGTVMHYDVETGKTVKFKETKVKGYDPDQFVAKQVFYESKDKTKVPMFIVHSKKLKPNATTPHPTLLYGYGGFNISLKPSFSISRLVWMQHFGGVYAVPNIRGGGEYGDEWHKAGTKLQKQNVFDDFQYAAKYLISSGYTSAEKLAIWGGSNGGLLTGACANQQPQLFGAVITAVGVLDMLRFHKFTIGYAWCSDYGNADESKEEFDALYRYSPVHNVKSGVQYPAVLVTTADHDDRVSPLHSYKFIAALQDKVGATNKKPLLGRIEVKAGHGAGKPLSKQIEEISDVFGFISKNLGATWRE